MIYKSVGFNVQNMEFKVKNQQVHKKSTNEQNNIL
jgi:hypothetical protein